jgi:hypothetical protein
VLGLPERADQAAVEVVVVGFEDHINLVVTVDYERSSGVVSRQRAELRRGECLTLTAGDRNVKGTGATLSIETSGAIGVDVLKLLENR